MTVRDIITNYLKENGFDGLVCNECCCAIDNLCSHEGYPCMDCSPAYKYKTKDCSGGKCESCADYEGYGEEGFIYCTRRPE